MLSAFRFFSLSMVFIPHEITQSLLPTTSMWSHVGLEHIEGYCITWLFVTCKIDTKFIIVQLTWFQISDVINHNRKECNSRNMSDGGDFRLRLVLYVGWKTVDAICILNWVPYLWHLLRLLNIQGELCPWKFSIAFIWEIIKIKRQIKIKIDRKKKKGKRKILVQDFLNVCTNCWNSFTKGKSMKY